VSALDWQYNAEYGGEGNEWRAWWMASETNYTHECINQSRGEDFALLALHRQVGINASDLEALCLSFVNLTEEQV
jgi:hypothetical protein